MHIQKRSLEGRGFTLQFQQVMQEFGDIIPWLKPARAIQYATNGAYFKRELTRTVGPLVAYQLTTHDTSREFLGGLLHFAKSPENFVDPYNRAVMTELERSGASYITCVQIRDVVRGQGHGTELVDKAIRASLKVHRRVWAVCEPELCPWYAKAGAKVLSRPHNKDHLAIIAW